MQKRIQSGTSDKNMWYKNHILSVEQKKKLIEDKLNRYIKLDFDLKKSKKK